MGFYDERVVPHLINWAMRNRHLHPYRERLLSQARGRVLEIGIGSGINLPLYQDPALEVVGLEPGARLVQMARGAARTSRIPVHIIAGSAEHIPLEDSSIDTVVTTWTLCSIPDAPRALAEMRRVLQPGGRLLFVEHGLAPQERVRRWQNRLTPAWRALAGGCHLNRPIRALVENAGFRIEEMQTGYLPGPKPMTFLYEGHARPA